LRCAVLAAADSWYYADLKRAAADRHELTCVPFRSLASTVSVRKGEPLRVRDPREGEAPALREGEAPAEPLNQLSPAVRIESLGSDLNHFDAVLVRTMPPGSLEQVVFRMDALARIEQAGVPVINPPRAIECAVDKYLTTARLAEAGLPVPRTVACQTIEDGLQAFETLGRDVVLKPLFGSEGRGIARLTDEAFAERACRLLVGLGSVLYLQEFIAHEGFDIRVLVIGKQVLAMRRVNKLDWRTNVSRGAIAEAIEPTDEWVALARQSAQVVGASVAGVDLLTGRDGSTFVIEVNAVPGWRAMSDAHDRDIAAMVLEHAAEVAAQRKSQP
jgi:ribosomal protein S6--L-glutamate ligase